MKQRSPPMNKAFYTFSTPPQTIELQRHLQAIENKVNNMKLMYRRPGAETHENITQSLDIIFHKLSELENRLNILEQKGDK